MHVHQYYLPNYTQLLGIYSYGINKKEKTLNALYVPCEVENTANKERNSTHRFEKSKGHDHLKQYLLLNLSEFLELKT